MVPSPKKKSTQNMAKFNSEWKKEICQFSADHDHITRIDLLWGYLQGVKVPGISPRFDLLFRVAETVLTIPHSHKKKTLAEVHCNLKAHKVETNNEKKQKSKSRLYIIQSIQTNDYFFDTILLFCFKAMYVMKKVQVSAI